MERGGRSRTRRPASAIPFHEAPAELLATDPDCWVLHPGESWHGFEGIPDGWCMLDPIKFGIVCPGMKTDGELDAKGIPADIVTAYLGRHGIVPSRTTDHMVLFLFSVGITKGKWGTLLNTLLDFKTDYDRNAPLAEVAARRRGRRRRARYAGMGLKDLGDEMWAHMKKSRQGHWQAQAYATLPDAGDDAAARVPAADGGRGGEGAARRRWRTASWRSGVIPYPPGIPIVMPGENVGARGWPVAHATCARCRSTGSISPDSPRKSKGRRSGTAIYHIYCLTK